MINQTPFPELWNLSPNTDKASLLNLLNFNTYSAIAAHFHETRHYPWPPVAEFSKTISSQEKVIDLGCGNGRNIIQLAKKGCSVTGMDTCTQLLEHARKKAAGAGILDRCDFMMGNLLNLPIRNNYFDAVLFIASFHHLPTYEQRQRSLRELYRILNIGGRALISVWRRQQEDKIPLLELWENNSLFESGDVIIPWTSGNKKYPRYYHLFTADEFSELLIDSPLEVIRLFTSGNNHYAHVIKK